MGIRTPSFPCEPPRMNQAPDGKEGQEDCEEGCFQKLPGYAIPCHIKSIAKLEEAGFSLLHDLPSMQKLINTRERGAGEIFNSKPNKRSWPSTQAVAHEETQTVIKSWLSTALGKQRKHRTYRPTSGWLCPCPGLCHRGSQGAQSGHCAPSQGTTELCHASLSTGKTRTSDGRS